MKLAEPLVTVCQVVAATQIGGGTRVIVLTAHKAQHPHQFIVNTNAYDSNHPHEVHGQGVYTGPNLDQLIARAREDEARAFEPSTDPEDCDCWARWDPTCGRRGCWGVPAGPAAH